MKSDSNILVYNLMAKIVNQTNRGNPVLKDSIPLNVVETMNTITEFDDDNSMSNRIIDEMDNMGGSSQVEYFLSQQREENDNNIEKQETQRNTNYKEVLSLFDEMVNSFPNKHLFDEMCELMRNRHMVYVASRGINNQLLNSSGITLFGENNTNKRTIKRHKFRQEAF